MRVDVVIVSDNEAAIYYRPGRLTRLWALLFPSYKTRPTYAPIVRVLIPTTPPAPPQWSWYHKYTGRPIDDEIMGYLERLPVQNDVRQALLAAAMDNDDENP